MTESKNLFKLEALGIFIASALVLSMGLYHHEFIGFETRFALFAQDMMQHGMSWFPLLFNQPYPDYPVTGTLLIYLFSLPFGHVTFFSANLPYVMTAATTLLVTYLIGAIYSRRWGLYAVVLQLMTWQFFHAARSLGLDLYPTLATVLCFYLVLSAQVYQRPKRLWFLPLCLLFGFAFRGPIGLIIPAAVVFSFYLLMRQWRKLIIFSCYAAILLVAAEAVLYLLAYLQGGMAFVHDVWVMQVSGRLGNNDRHIFYYFTNAIPNFSVSYILAIATVIALAKQLWRQQLWRRPLLDEIKFISLLLGWILIIMLGMTLALSKWLRYILPIVPALSLIAAYPFVHQHKQQGLELVRNVFNFICYSLPFAGVALLAVASKYGQMYGVNLIENLNIHGLWVTLLLGCLAAFCIAKFLKTKPIKQQTAILLLGFMMFVTATVLVVEPLVYQHNLTTPFVQRVEGLLKPQQKLVFYQIGPDGLAINFAVNSRQHYAVDFVNEPKQALAYPQAAIFVTKQKIYLRDKPHFMHRSQVVAKGKLGHKPAIAFVMMGPTK